MVEVVPVRYRPPADTYRLDIELVDAAELRARVAIADVSAKDVIVARIVLGAKRRLALTDDPVAAVSRSSASTRQRTS